VIPVITVCVRHAKDCPHKDAGELFRNCKCRKSLRYFYDGKQRRQSAKTRSWATAEQARRALEKRFQETDQPAQEPETRTTIERAIQLFTSDKRSQGVSVGVLKKYELELMRLQDFLGKRLKLFPAEINKEDLTEFRNTWERWYPSANTRIKVQERLRGFLRYCYESRLIDRVPKLSPIGDKKVPTLPLTDEQYEKLLDTIPETFKTPPEKAARVRGLVQLMRHFGLAIRDAVTLERSEMQHDIKRNLYRVVTSRQKTGTHVRVPIPPGVATEILSVTCGNPKYLFWNRGEGTPETAVKKWHHDLRRLFDDAGLKDGNPHQLRDTFACSLLSKGVPLEEVSKLLGHESIKTTEKHYSAWVKSRQERADELVMGTWADNASA
jgi:integrase/recombinase XerD